MPYVLPAKQKQNCFSVSEPLERSSKKSTFPCVTILFLQNPKSYWRGRDFITSRLKNNHWLQLLGSEHKNFADTFTSWVVTGVAASKCMGTTVKETVWNGG
jgi:hypothetical protein